MASASRIPPQGRKGDVPTWIRLRPGLGTPFLVRAGLCLGLAAGPGPAWEPLPRAAEEGPPGASEEEARAEAVALVKKAIAYFKAHGRKAMVAEVSRTQSTLRKGSLYVFVCDMGGRVVAHGQFARLAGYDLSGFHDPTGKAYMQERIQLAKEKGSGWQDYVFLNPDTKKWEPKRAYIEACDGLIFGCGVYRPAEPRPEPAPPTTR